LNRPSNETGGAPPRTTAPVLFGVILLALGAAMFWWTGRWMIARFNHEGGYYSHGWLVPLVVGFLLWRKREALAACPKRAYLPGLFLLVPSLLAQFLATLLQVGFLSGLALLGVVAGLVLTLMGPQFLRLVLFPVAFLAFMVPIPEFVIDVVSFRMKLLSAGVAAGVADLFGLIAIREGSFIRIPHGTLEVDNVCSGLKYLIALMAFSALYAHLASVKTWQKWVLFLLSIPISFLANVGRVTLMVIVGYQWGISAVEKWYFHDLFGFVLFIVAFVCLFAVESLLLAKPLWLRGRNEEGARAAKAGRPAPAAAPHAPRRPPDARRLGAGVLCAMAVVAALSVSAAWRRPVSPASDILNGIPKSVGDWIGADQKLDPRVYDILGTRDVLSRSYVNSRGERVSFLIVLAQQSPSRTHAPEQCLSGEGDTIVGARDRDLVVGARTIPFREILLSSSQGSRLSWHFYKSGEHLTTSYWGHQIGIVLRRIKEPLAADVLIRAETETDLNDSGRGARVLEDFFDAATPSVLSKLP
jgi:EpsI family protein